MILAQYFGVFFGAPDSWKLQSGYPYHLEVYSKYLILWLKKGIWDQNVGDI